MKNKRIIPVLVVVAVTVFIMWWIYGSEFHYPNTEAGRQEAVEAYVLSTEDQELNHGLIIGKTPVRVVAWQEYENKLFIFYRTESKDNVQGIVELDKGINGKYMPIRATRSPSKLLGELYTTHITPKNTEETLFVIGNEAIEGVKYVDVTFSQINYSGVMQEPIVKRYDVSENFLIIQNEKALIEELGFQYVEYMMLCSDKMQLFDENGQDVTANYIDDTVEQSWGGSKDTAEIFMIYVTIGMIAIIGLVIAKYVSMEWK